MNSMRVEDLSWLLQVRVCHGAEAVSSVEQHSCLPSLHQYVSKVMPLTATAMRALLLLVNLVVLGAQLLDSPQRRYT